MSFKDVKEKEQYWHDNKRHYLDKYQHYNKLMVETKKMASGKSNSS